MILSQLTAQIVHLHFTSTEDYFRLSQLDQKIRKNYFQIHNLFWQQVRAAHPTGAGVAHPEVVCPVGQDRSGAVTITVHAKPGSKHSSITGHLRTAQKDQTPAV